MVPRGGLAKSIRYLFKINSLISARQGRVYHPRGPSVDPLKLKRSAKSAVGFRLWESNDALPAALSYIKIRTVNAADAPLVVDGRGPIRFMSVAASQE